MWDTIWKTIKDQPFFMVLTIIGVVLLVGATGASFMGIDVPLEQQKDFGYGGALFIMLAAATNVINKLFEDRRQERESKIRIALAQEGLLGEANKRADETIIRVKE